MKSTAFFSAGGAGILASLLSYFGHDGDGSTPSLITALLGGGGLLSVILGFIPDGKKVDPDGGGGDKPDGGLSFANFTKALAMYKAAKAVGSPGDAKLTKEEVMGILKLFMPEVASDIAFEGGVAEVSAGPSIKDVHKFAQFITQLMQLGPVADTFKSKGWPAYTKLEMVWDATTAHTPSFGADPRVVDPPKAAA